MTKRYYYTDPLKALYMMREFEVGLECKYFYIQKNEDRFYPFKQYVLDEPEMIGNLMQEFEDFRNIYVTKESEKIFEPIKQDDLILYRNDEFKEIVTRNGKHFFMPKIEEENENNK